MSGKGVLLGDLVVGVVWMEAVCQWSPDLIQKVQDEIASFWLGHLSSCALSESEAQAVHEQNGTNEGG